MTERCVTLGCPEVVRLAEQDDCSGAPIAGAGLGYVLSCLRNWSIAPIVRDGDTSEFVSDCGKVVARFKQDDQLSGYTISFETSTRSNELEALLTGKELIADGGLNIGTYGVESAIGCSSGETNPRFIIEAFYRLNQCVSDANHVRLVLPLGQFKVTELDKEGTITFFRYTAETSSSQAVALGDGPYHDFPASVTAFLASKDPGEYTTGFDFEESITISGSCGSVEVPASVPAQPEVAYDCATDTLTISATGAENFSSVMAIGGESQYGGFTGTVAGGFFYPDPQMIVVNSTTIQITNASKIVFTHPFTLHQLGFDDGVNTFFSWIGTVNIEPC